MSNITSRVFPAGDYPFTVTAFQRAEYPGSTKFPPCKMAVLTVEIDGGALGTMLIQDRLFLHRRQEWKLRQFFTAIGQRKANGCIHMDWSTVPGARGVVRLARDSAVTHNRVEGYIPSAGYAQIDSGVDLSKGGAVNE